MKTKIKKLLLEAFRNAQTTGELPAGEPPPFDVERPKVREHGEFASNLALLLAPKTHRKAPEIAVILQKALAPQTVRPETIVGKVEVAGGGFLNFTLKKRAWQESLREIAALGDRFGRNQEEGQEKGQEKVKKRRVLIEFISANPTGPLHIGNARGGPIGDVLASLLEATGHEVVREYYVNDVGGQIEKLGQAVDAEIKRLSGEPSVAEAVEYRGEYITEMARECGEKTGSEINDIGFFAVGRILDDIRRDCEGMGIIFDSWIREGQMAAATQECLEALTQKGVARKREGALWFAPSDEFLEDRESVLIRSDGRPTYFANDIAYHRGKYARGFDRILNIWGSNHHGHVPRLKAAMKALGCDPERLQVVLYQFVRVKRGTEVVKMSKRAGNYVTTREVLEEVGRDALRFFLLMRAPESHLDFDLELAKKHSQENPVYYVQYAHARLASLFRKAVEKKIPPPGEQTRLELLDLPEEIGLIRRIHEFPEEVLLAARRLEPQRIPFYLLELAKEFQAYYSRAREDPRYRVLSADVDTSQAKLYLCATLRNTFASGLKLIGVSAPEVMEAEEEGSDE